MGEHKFIRENSHLQKIWTLASLISILLIILVISLFFSTLFYSLLLKTPFASKIITSVTNSISNTTVKGLFYTNLVGGIFFVPSPDELIFYYALTIRKSYFLTLIGSLAGYMLAQVINYFLGKKASGIILNLMSKKKVYSARRLASKYGAWGIFLFNFLPFLPAPVLSFALGIAKYNFKRLFILTLLGKLAIYLVVMLIHAII